MTTGGARHQDNFPPIQPFSKRMNLSEKEHFSFQPVSISALQHFSHKEAHQERYCPYLCRRVDGANFPRKAIYERKAG